MGKFKLYVEEDDIFGFEELKAKKDAEDTPAEDEGEFPIKSFNVQWMMDVLARKKIGNRIKSNHAFLDEVIWPEKKIGAVRVKITPNILVFIERLVEDMLGQRTWVMKATFKPDLTEYAGHEDIVAYDIFDEVEKLYFQDVDRASEEYKSFFPLVQRITTRLRSNAPEQFSYQDIKQVTPDHYIISFDLRNAGVGKLIGRAHQAMTPQATIDVNYNKERGLIHIIFTTVSVGHGTGKGAWEVDIPILDAFYAPSQDKDEIVDTIVTAFKYY